MTDILPLVHVVPEDNGGMIWDRECVRALFCPTLLVVDGCDDVVVVGGADEEDVEVVAVVAAVVAVVVDEPSGRACVSGKLSSFRLRSYSCCSREFTNTLDLSGLGVMGCKGMALCCGTLPTVFNSS